MPETCPNCKRYINKGEEQVKYYVQFRRSADQPWETEKDGFDSIHAAQDYIQSVQTNNVGKNVHTIEGEFKVMTDNNNINQEVNTMDPTITSWMDWPVAQNATRQCIKPSCGNQFEVPPPIPGKRYGAMNCPICGASTKLTEKGFRASRRFVTSIPTVKRAAKLAAYAEDLEKKMPVELLTDKYGMTVLFRNRNFRNAFLEEFILSQGWNFNMQVFMNSREPDMGLPIERAKDMILDRVPGWVTAISWANDTSIVVMELIRPDGTKASWMEFCSELGINILNSTKMAKRLSEVVRETLFSKRFTWSLASNAAPPLNIQLADGMYEDELHADGISVISQSFAKSLCESIPDPVVRKRQVRNITNGKIRRVNLRVLIDPSILEQFPTGALLKGDAIIISDLQMVESHGDQYDIVTHSVNFKPELGLKANMGAWATMFPHHASNPAATDSQTMSWFQPLFPLDRLSEDMERMNTSVIEGLRDGSGIPAHMVVSMKDGADDQVTQESLIEANQMMTQLWTACGLDLNLSQFFMNWIGKGHLNMIDRVRDRDEQDGRTLHKYYDLRFPMRWSAYMHVVTHQHLVVCGYGADIIGREDKAFFHKETHSLAIPNGDFVANYRRHGGWDLDDAIKATPVWINNDEGAKLKLIGIRCPNSYGEYGIYDVDLTDFPFYFEYGGFPHIQEDELPLYIDQLNVTSTLDVLPEGRQVDKKMPMSADDAVWMIECLANNPGVGQWVNPMIAQSAARYDANQRGDFISPYRTVQLAETEWFVDKLTAEFDLDAFNLINEDIESSYVDLETLIGKLDRYTARTRARRLFSAVMKGKSDMAIVKEGYFWDANELYAAQVKKYRDDLAKFSLNERITIEELMEVHITEGERAYANKELFLWFGQMSKKAPGEKAPSYIKRQHWADMSSEIVQRILTARTPGGTPLRWHKVLIALYQRLHNANQPMKDLILFQAPASEGEISAMYLLIKVIEHYAPHLVTVSPEVNVEFDLTEVPAEPKVSITEMLSSLMKTE